MGRESQPPSQEEGKLVAGKGRTIVCGIREVGPGEKGYAEALANCLNNHPGENGTLFSVISVRRERRPGKQLSSSI